MTPLAELLADHQEFHSDLQMDAFITLRAGGTLYGCYKQALRELDARTMALLQRYESQQLLEIDIRELAVSDHVDPWQAARDKVRLGTKRAMLSKCQQVIADTEREFWRFYCQADSIRIALSAQGVQFPLDDVTRDRLDRDMWEHRLKCMAAVEYMQGGRLAGSTLEFLHAAPPAVRHRLAPLIFDERRHQELFAWYMEHESEMPPPSRLEFSDVRKLVECSK